MIEIFENIKFGKNGLIPAVIQDEKSKKALTLCYMNKKALEKTLKTGKVYVYRRSKGRVMMKGETSGCVQRVRSVCIDCEGNSLLVKVEQERAACHEGYFSCYFRKMDKKGRLKTIEKRIFDPKKVYRVLSE
ncbi:MAG: phosphoribosyl-AMP cyclohydrolase [Omnitrophica bacterium RIFCSPLOWO2_01_FULL_45_10]|nr:MAG: phosphoribosyl-AMP cyclohydrolase [Omnitrophica bacterium RIFCSPLOWO2_01_FULL_45_10]